MYDPLANICSGPIVALILARVNAVKGWRTLMGPTDTRRAQSESPNRYCSLYPIMYVCEQ